MRRTLAWPLAVMLAAVTGAVLAATVGTLRAPVSTDAPDTANAAVVRAFYDAVDVLLRTGDSAALASLIAADFVDHAPAPGLPPTQDGLGRALLELRVIFPDLRILPEEVTATGDRVVARVRVEGSADARFLGLSLGGGFVPWGPLELFRVVGRHVVERWGIAPSARFAPMGSAPLDRPTPPRQVVDVTRWTFPPRTRFETTAGDEERWLLDETGGLTVTIIGSPAGSAPVSSDRGGLSPPAPDEILAVPKGARYVVANGGDDPAAVIVIRLVPSALAGAGSVAGTTGRSDPAYAQPVATPDAKGVTTLPGGVAVQPLAGGEETTLPEAPAAVALGKVTLAPGTELPPSVTLGPVLVVVLDGELEFDAGAGLVWVRWGATGASTKSRAPSLGGGDGALASLGTDLSVRNRTEEVVTFLVVTIMPVAATLPA